MTDRTLALCRAAFDRWRGGAVEFVTLRRSARTAVFEVVAPDGKVESFSLLDPSRIASKIRWTNCDLSIEETVDEDQRYIVRDHAACFEVSCGAVTVHNAPPK